MAWGKHFTAKKNRRLYVFVSPNQSYVDFSVQVGPRNYLAELSGEEAKALFEFLRDRLSHD